MKTPSLFEGLEQGATLSGSSSNPYYRVIDGYLIKPQHNLILQGPCNAQQAIDTYAMAPLLLLCSSMGSDLLGRSDFRVFTDLVARATLRYNEAAQPPVTPGGLLKTRLMNVLPTWPQS